MTLSEKLSAYDVTLPFERAEPIPSAWLTDPEIYEETCERVFRNSWQVVARSDELAESGSFLPLELAGVPVLLWHGQDGVLRAMHNVCEHQGYGPLASYEKDRDRLTTLVCPNHRATYKCTGALHAMPGCANLADLQERGVGLRQYALETFGPLVAVHLGQPKESFTELLTPLPERLGAAVNTMHFHKRFTYSVPYSLLQAITNYLDRCSHCLSWHRNSIARNLNLEGQTCEVFRFGNVQHVPGAALTGRSGNTHVRAGDKNYYFFWPNFTFNDNGDGTFDTNHFIPLGPNRCLIVNDAYHDGTKEDAFMGESNAIMDMVQGEDNAACTGLQRGNESPHFERGFYSRPYDMLIHHFHCMLAKALQEGLEKEGGTALPG